MSESVYGTSITGAYPIGSDIRTGREADDDVRHVPLSRCVIPQWLPLCAPHLLALQTTLARPPRIASSADSTIGSIVSRVINAGTFPKSANAVYFVITANNIAETSGFCTSFCGWHTHGAQLRSLLRANSVQPDHTSVSHLPTSSSSAAFRLLLCCRQAGRHGHQVLLCGRRQHAVPRLLRRAGCRPQLRGRRGCGRTGERGGAVSGADRSTCSRDRALYGARRFTFYLGIFSLPPWPLWSLQRAGGGHV